MTKMPRVPRLTEAVVTYNAKACTWTVEREYRVRSLGCDLVVPRGFVSDLASIPRWFWWLVASFELSIGAALVHDWIYRHGGLCRGPTGLLTIYTRLNADQFLYDIAAQDGVWWWRRWIALKAVRWFGASAWQATSPPLHEAAS